MKHIKLFEQIDEWDDPFGEDITPEKIKFEVGDKVEILNNRGGGRLIIGSIGTITKVESWTDGEDEAFLYYVVGEEINGSHRKYSWCYNEYQLKKVEE